MTNDELRALADTVNSIYAETYTQREAIDSVVAYLRACADAQPVAMLASHRRLIEQAIQSAEHPSGMSTHDGKARIDASVLRRMLSIIDSRPAPAAPQAEPKREPLSDERINEIGEPFGYFTYGDAQGDKRRAFVRAIESSHGIGYGKAIEGGPSELRSCTCHPDDNPPVPCARQYALNECRAASEPTEAQIVAVADVLLAWEAEVSDRVPARVLAEDVLRAALAAKD